MEKQEKKFLVSTVVLTVIVLVIMTMVAILVPKKHFALILVAEIALAVVWTIVSACNIAAYVKRKDNQADNKPGNTE